MEKFHARANLRRMEPFVARLGLYRDGGGALVLDYANFTGAGTLGRLFDGEVGSLTLPQ